MPVPATAVGDVNDRSIPISVRIISVGIPVSVAAVAAGIRIAIAPVTVAGIPPEPDTH